MKIQSINGCNYRLPNELNKFQLRMYVHLINWKWRCITKEPGYYQYKRQSIPYDAILPHNPFITEDIPHLYPTIRRQFLKHYGRNPFRIHPHFFHMSSSQAANINLFLPILYHTSASDILRTMSIWIMELLRSFDGYLYALTKEKDSLHAAKNVHLHTYQTKGSLKLKGFQTTTPTFLTISAVSGEW